MIEIREATSVADLQAVRGLWRQYWAELGFTPCFQGFSEELASLPGRYATPSGCLLIAFDGDEPAGAIAFRSLDAATCEAKRLYVAQSHRGKGLARSMMAHLIHTARTAGYSRMVGDTMPVMADALALYDRLGFRRIDGYAGSTEGAICIELPL